MSLAKVGLRVLGVALVAAVLLAVATVLVVMTDLLTVLRNLSGPDVRLDLRDAMAVVAALLQYVLKWL